MISYKFDMSVRDVVNLLLKSKKFRIHCANIMKDIKYDGYMFAITKLDDYSKDLDKEFVIYIKPHKFIDNGNPELFMEYLCSKKKWVSFPNLSGDSLLLVPSYNSDYNKYANISNFCNQASINEIADMWKEIAKYIKKYDKKSLYVNTHGLGVPWLHIRFDEKSKYVYWIPKDVKKRSRSRRI